MAFSVSDEAKRRLDEIKQQYPDPRSAVMPAIYLVQEEHGEVSDEGVHWIAETLQIAPVHVLELVTFYTMFRRKPLGKYHIQVCKTLSCGLCGARQLSNFLHARLGIEPGEVTDDGLFSFEQVECLGSCGSAPMCEINDTYFENLTPEKLGEILDAIEKQRPDLSLSTKRDALGSGLEEYPKSQVWSQQHKQ